MLDFTLALYLGFQHPSWSLPEWSSLTLGKPAALEEPPGIRAVERRLADLTGCGDVMLATSTLHAFFDLFAMLGNQQTAVLIDRSSYPIARWGAQHAASGGSAISFFSSHDLVELRWVLSRPPQLRPLIVTDGLSPATGITAPLAEYAKLAALQGGLVLVDDTQALGILGVSASSFCPFGIGGGGSLRYTGVYSGEVIIVNSLAKAFGVPVAMIGGEAHLIDELRRHSVTRTHCSPPSVAVITAAAQALERNKLFGESLRARLARNVAYLRSGLKKLGVAASRSLFPLQPLRIPSSTAFALHSALLHRGVRTVLQRNPDSSAQLSFIVTARHKLGEIQQALEVLTNALESGNRTRDRQELHV